MSPAEKPAYIEFCGEHYPIDEGRALTVGREADVVIDDNPYLHRRLLHIRKQDGILWIANVGASITATLADEAGLVQLWLSPGATVPILFARTTIWFTAGPTTYELEVVFDGAPVFTASVDWTSDAETTQGRASLTPDQRMLILTLAEDILRRGNRGAGSIPPSSAAAERLDWGQSKFNRKLDHLCEKLARTGVRGLTSEGGRVASMRRARMVEYALASRMVVGEDLALLDALPPTRPRNS